MVNARDTLQLSLTARSGCPPVEWQVLPGLTGYEDAVAAMEARVAAIVDGLAPEAVWLVEHPALVTAGTSARAGEHFDTDLPVFSTGRGGQHTYHGPGQRVVYVMLDLSRRRQDLRAFVAGLESWIIDALASLGIAGERREDRVGVWVLRRDKGPGAEDKIAALGIRVRRWVTFHGLSINVSPRLEHFAGIIPCGVRDARFGVTSLVDLGHDLPMHAVDEALKAHFVPIFGPLLD